MISRINGDTSYWDTGIALLSIVFESASGDQNINFEPSFVYHISEDKEDEYDQVIEKANPEKMTLVIFLKKWNYLNLEWMVEIIYQYDLN